MARELSQEELLDFLCQAGGRVTNAALLGHFKSFLRDPSVAPGQLQQRRELFKSLVNSVAAVRQDPDGTKYVVLKKRYRDLVGEEGLRGPRCDPQPAAPQQQTRSPGAPAASPGSRRRAPRLRQQSQPAQQQPQLAQQQPHPQKQQQQPQLQPQKYQSHPYAQQHQRRPQTQPQSEQQQPRRYQPQSLPQQYPSQFQPQQQQPQPQQQLPRPQPQPRKQAQAQSQQPQTQPQQPQPQPESHQWQLQEQESQPQPQRARRQPGEKEAETEPAGTGPAVPEIECNGLSTRSGDAPESTETPGKERGRLGEAVAEGLSPQVRVRTADAGAQGGCCWECVQDNPWAGSTEPLLSHGSPLLEELQARELSSGGPLESTLHSSWGSSTKPSPLATETFRASETSPSSASLALPGNGSELLTLSGPHSYAAQQQQRTREWVANHSPSSPGSVAGRTQEGPRRFWCVLPENFPEMPSDFDPLVSERLLLPFPASPPLLPAGASVFRSIRCQLDLQDLENFVEEDSHDSEESTSGPRESPGELEEAPKIPLENGGQEKLRTPVGHFIKSQQENIPLNKLQGPIFRSGYSLQHIPERVNGPVVTPNKTSRESSSLPQDPMPWPTGRLKRSLRRSSRVGRDKMSSSDEELLDEDLVKRNRRPPRSRRSSRAGALPCPKVDAPLIPKPTVHKTITEQRLADRVWVSSGNVSSVLISLRPSVHKSSLVPLDSREHEWIVRLASGSWVQALSLFWEDPQLALRKDFLTGYTALHWIAKHGALQALQDLVKGAQKAGIVLDMNVRSSCGYTPLHLAAIHGHQGIIKLLVQKLESRVNIRDSSGKKPWQYLTSNTTGEIWQLLGAPRGKPIFPVYSLVGSASPTRKAKNHDVSRHISRKTSLAALLKSQHNRWKMAHQYDKFRTLGERDEYSD
ncbi:ankyrin repeat domain-containing protein SOWAHB [Sarcophilus harrisii]|uniref:Sosondowah ankyrin repeat domain family member B n=1 Tax=Sarcophilus harrisii TaxID=9305 RepID=A0A7N4NVJ8_SARHA|nr:ankyrin repeat domain-containing protein SOWAHB [Sarcophilus harrisii]